MRGSNSPCPMERHRFFPAVPVVLYARFEGEPKRSGAAVAQLAGATTVDADAPRRGPQTAPVVRFHRGFAAPPGDWPARSRERRQPWSLTGRPPRPSRAGLFGQHQEVGVPVESMSPWEEIGDLPHIGQCRCFTAICSELRIIEPTAGRQPKWLGPS